MAVKTGTIQELKRNEIVVDVLQFEAATTAADGIEVDISNYSDHNLAFLFNNTSADTDYKVTIKKGNGLQGVTDIEKTITKGKTAGVVIESGRFKNVTGSGKGKVLVVPANAAVEMVVVALPL